MGCHRGFDQGSGAAGTRRCGRARITAESERRCRHPAKAAEGPGEGRARSWRDTELGCCGGLCTWLDVTEEQEIVAVVFPIRVTAGRLLAQAERQNRKEAEVRVGKCGS